MGYNLQIMLDSSLPKSLSENHRGVSLFSESADFGELNRTEKKGTVRVSSDDSRLGSKLFRSRSRIALATISLLCLNGCWSPSPSEVVVYTAQDSEFAEPIFEQFTTQSGIEVLPKYDTEATKTVGLAAAIIAESSRPRADVFWNNEILNTLRLKKLGLLDTYASVIASNYPAEYRDSKNNLWHGFAARARILVVNKNLCSGGDRPTSIDDLADQKWRGRIGMAKPLFGTTATHAACLKETAVVI